MCNLFIQIYNEKTTTSTQKNRATIKKTELEPYTVAACIEVTCSQ